MVIAAGFSYFFPGTTSGKTSYFHLAGGLIVTSEPIPQSTGFFYNSVRSLLFALSIRNWARQSRLRRFWRPLHVLLEGGYLFAVTIFLAAYLFCFSFFLCFCYAEFVASSAHESMHEYASTKVSVASLS